MIFCVKKYTCKIRTFFYANRFIHSVATAFYLYLCIFLSDPCYYYDQDYYGGDIKCVKQNSLTDCQQLCQNTDGCERFSYVTDKYNGKHGPAARRGCCLKKGYRLKLTKEVGVISGHKICYGEYGRLMNPL